MSSSDRRNEKISSPVAASFFIVSKGAEKSISPELCMFIESFFATSKFWIWSRIFSWRGEDPDDFRLPLFRIFISGPVLGPYNNLGVMYTPIRIIGKQSSQGTVRFLCGLLLLVVLQFGELLLQFAEFLAVEHVFQAIETFHDVQLGERISSAL